MDKEYLSRPLVEGVKYEINDDRIYVGCSHTLYVSCARIKNTLTKQSLLDLYLKVYRLAKEQKVAVGRRGYKKIIMELWDEYEREILYCNDLFDRMVVAFEKVQERGIHSGTTDDRVLEHAMNIRNEHNEIYHRTSAYSKINDIHSTLTRLYDDLSSQNNGYRLVKIYI